MTAREKNEEISKLKEILALVRTEFDKNYILYRKILNKETILHIQSMGYQVESVTDRIYKHGNTHIIENAYKVSW